MPSKRVSTTGRYIAGSGLKRSVAIVTAFPGAVIDGVRLTDCTFLGVEAADVLKHAGSLTFENLTVEPAKKKK